MSVSWSATGEMLSGIGTIGAAFATAAGAGAVIWAAHKAAQTVDSWRLQKVAERKFEHAERTLTAVHNAREALAYIRGALIHSYELEAAKEVLKKDEGWATLPEARQERLATAQAIIERMKRANESADELAKCIPLAKALFDENLEKSVSELHRQFWIIRTWADAYAEEPGNDREFSIKIRRELWSDDTEYSNLAKSVADSLQVIDDICLPVLRA